MGKVARPRVVTKDALDTEGLPDRVQVALGEIAGAAREGVLALSVACGLQVVAEIMAADVARICGPRGKHLPEREAYRHGSEPRLVPLGGALVEVERPRVRSTGSKEVPLPSYEVFTARDLLDDVALGRMLAGLSTRRYRAGEAPTGDVELKGTSRSAISRRFRRATEGRLAEIFGRDLSEIDLLAIFIDGIAVGEHVVVVALGVDADGRKHPLGLWEGTTENKAVCSALLGNLIDRGLDASRPVLFVIDGGKGIRSAIRAVYGELAPVQRCRAHKERNVTDHLPRPSGRSWPASSGRRGPRRTRLRPSGTSGPSPERWRPSIRGRPPRSGRGWRRPSPSPGWGSPRRCFGRSSRRTPWSR